MVVEALQHEAVAAQGDDDLGLLNRGLPVALRQAGAAFLGLGAFAGGEGDARHDEGSWLG